MPKVLREGVNGGGARASRSIFVATVKYDALFVSEELASNHADL